MDPDSERFLDGVGALGPPLLRSLDALEKAARYLHPPLLQGLRRTLAPLAPALEAARSEFESRPAPEDLASFAARLGEAARLTRESLDLFLDARPGPEATARVLGALQRHCRAQAALYPLRTALPPVARYFLEPEVQERADSFDPDPPLAPRVGIHDAHNAPEQRGGFTLYVPEWIDGTTPRPLVVALHGGSGHGAEFLWTWLREARSRGFLLLAPTSRGATWSLHGADHDAGPLDAMIEFVAQRWPVDRGRVLLTGLSDGATYSLLYGLRDSAPCTAIAPVSGVLHPANFASGNMRRARGRRVYLVHGRLDWLFPVGLARAAAEELQRAGADLVYREIEDLSHTYPREANSGILRWFDPALDLAARGEPRL
jgi:phospholipase/carboxylesterase